MAATGAIGKFNLCRDELRRDCAEPGFAASASQGISDRARREPLVPTVAPTSAVAERGRQSPSTGARSAVVISTPARGVHGVTAAAVLSAFSCGVDTCPEAMSPP